MSSIIQNQITPRYDMMQRDSSLLNKDKEAEIPGEGKVDFLKLLGESNKIKQEEIKKTKSGDFSDSKDYDAFLDKVNGQDKNIRVPKNTLEKDDFLKLFITQLQQQDPLKPKDGAEMAAQLAQFNHVEQMMNMNKTLGQIKDLNEKTDEQSVSNYLGKDISIVSSKMAFKDGSHNELFAIADKPYESVILEIKDDKGQAIHQQELGALKQGENQIKWDGKGAQEQKISDGTYTVELKGKLDGGGEQVIPMETRVKVTGATLGKNLGLDTAVGKIALADVKHIRLAQEKPESRQIRPQNNETQEKVLQP